MRIQTHRRWCVCIFLTKILTTCVIYDNISYYIIIIFAGVNFDNKYCRVSGWTAYLAYNER